MAEKKDKKIRCSFCGREQDGSCIMVHGPGVNICELCIDTCKEIVSTEYGDIPGLSGKAPESVLGNDFILPKPVDLKKKLDEYVVGQDSAKKALCVAVYNHYKRIMDNERRAKGADSNDDSMANVSDEIKNTLLSKSNVLLIGPTGVGKTYLAQTLAKILNVPFAIADATSLTEAGYVGDDVENILLRLIQAADGDVQLAERGIIFVDEIDKISRKTENVSITRDVSGEGVQQALLKILEGTVAHVPPNGGRKHPTQEYIKIDTTNILFICSGAFDGLAKIIENRMGKATIGFSGKLITEESFDQNALLPKVEPQDLLRFGLIPEFIGRVPSVVTLEALDVKQLTSILTQPKDALIKQYQKLLSLDGVVLEFDDDAIEAIAKLAMERKTGARGLRAIVEGVMQDVMFSVPSENVKRLIVTKQTVEMKTPPLIEYRSEEGN